MKSLRLRIPPIVTTLLLGCLMKLITKFTPDLAWTIPGNFAIATGLGLLGATLALVAVLTFRRARTTINPRQLTAVTNLVTHGVFRLSRNPMYLGMALALAGWAVWLNHPLALAVAALYVPLMNYLQILPEEKAMTAKFGAVYATYQTQVRRWL